MCPLLCITCTEISFRRILGKDRPRSSFSISKSSAANSTPVGPPPLTTNDNSRRRSSSVVVGKQARSRFSRILFLISLASSIVLRKLQFSSPLTPCGFVVEPGSNQYRGRPSFCQFFLTDTDNKLVIREVEMSFHAIRIRLTNLY